MAEEHPFPSELIVLLQDFILAAVKEDPEDIINFAASYFKTLQEEKKKDKDNYSKDVIARVNAEINHTSTATIPKLSTSNDGAICRNSISRKCSFNRLLKRRNSIAGEPYEPFGSARWEKCVVYTKSTETRQRVENIVKEIFIFKSCSSDQLQKIIDAMYEREVFANEVVIKQGDQGDNFYVIDQGKFVFLFESDDGKDQIGSIEGPGSFGELALMYNCPRSATVKAVDNGVVWVLDRCSFKQILVDTTEMKRRYYEELLEGVPILSMLTAYERMTLADALETKVFEDSECIIKQESIAECMYFIEEGIVEIILEGHDEQPSQVISNATRGDYFGELALVNKTNRSASVYSRGRVVCATLDVNAFERLLGPCRNLMKRNVEKYENQRKMLGIKELPQ